LDLVATDPKNTVDIWLPKRPLWKKISKTSAIIPSVERASRVRHVPIEWSSPLAWRVDAGKTDWQLKNREQIADLFGVEVSELERWVSLPLRVPNLTVLDLLSVGGWLQGRERRELMWRELEYKVYICDDTREAARLEWEKTMWEWRNSRLSSLYLQLLLFDRNRYLDKLREDGLPIHKSIIGK